MLGDSLHIYVKSAAYAFPSNNTDWETDDE